MSSGESPDVRKRPIFPTLMALLFSILALSNATKVFQASEANPVGGFVFFGVRFRDTAPILLLALPFAALLATYARGLWTQKKWVAWISVPYAFYVPTNLTLFWFYQPADKLPPMAFIYGYLFLALGGAIGTALWVMRHFEELQD